MEATALPTEAQPLPGVKFFKDMHVVGNNSEENIPSCQSFLLQKVMTVFKVGLGRGVGRESSLRYLTVEPACD